MSSLADRKTVELKPCIKISTDIEDNVTQCFGPDSYHRLVSKDAVTTYHPTRMDPLHYDESL